MIAVVHVPLSCKAMLLKWPILTYSVTLAHYDNYNPRTTHKDDMLTHNPSAAVEEDGEHTLEILHAPCSVIYIISRLE